MNEEERLAAIQQALQFNFITYEEHEFLTKCIVEGCENNIIEQYQNTILKKIVDRMKDKGML